MADWILKILVPMYIYVDSCILLTMYTCKCMHMFVYLYSKVLVTSCGVSGPAQPVKGAVQPARFFSSTPTMVLLCQWYCTICTTLAPPWCCTGYCVRAMYAMLNCYCVNGTEANVYH